MKNIKISNESLEIFKKFQNMAEKAEKLKSDLNSLYWDMAHLFEDGTENWEHCASAAIDAENCGQRISDVKFQ